MRASLPPSLQSPTYTHVRGCIVFTASARFFFSPFLLPLLPLSSPPTPVPLYLQRNFSCFLSDSLSFGFSFIRPAFALISNAMRNSSLALARISPRRSLCVWLSTALRL